MLCLSAKSGEGFDVLRDVLLAQACPPPKQGPEAAPAAAAAAAGLVPRGLSGYGEHVPLSWLKFLVQLGAQGAQRVSFEEATRIFVEQCCLSGQGQGEGAAAAGGAPAGGADGGDGLVLDMRDGATKREMDLMLGYFHSCGLLLWWDAPHLRQLIVLRWALKQNQNLATAANRFWIEKTTPESEWGRGIHLRSTVALCTPFVLTAILTCVCLPPELPGCTGVYGIYDGLRCCGHSGSWT